MAKKRAGGSDDLESAESDPAASDLIDAITTGDAEGLRAALASGSSLTNLPGTKFSPLTLAIRSMNPDNTTDQTVLIDTLLAVGADPNDGGMKQPTPIIRAIENQVAYPVQVRYVLEQLVQHGADLSKSSPEQSGGETSPLQAAAVMGLHDLVIWMLHRRDRSDVSNVIQVVLRMLDSMARNVGEEFAASQKQTYQPIIDTLTRYDGEGELPTLPEANEMLLQRQKAFVERHMKGCQSGTQLAELMDQLAESYASELEDGSEAFSAVVPAATDVEDMPPDVSLEPIDEVSWVRVDRRNNAARSFESLGFVPVGCFQISGTLHYVEAFVQPSWNLYGTIEQVEGQQFFRVIRLHDQDQFQIATNERDTIDVEVPGFELFWKTVAAARPVASHFGDGELTADHSGGPDKGFPVPATAERFVEHYCLGYRLFRKRLLDVLGKSRPPNLESPPDN